MKAVNIVATILVSTLMSWALLGVSTPARAQHDAGDPLLARLQALPPTVGANHNITVRRGESWTRVGIREHVGYLHISRANPQGFRPGTLLIPGRHIAKAAADTGIVLNLPELTIFYFRDGRALYWYPVSIGMVAERWHTVTGSFAIKRMEVNPYWDRPQFAGGGTFPPGPDNPLGDRLIEMTIPYYSLHSTNDPTTIGKLISHGCIRMFPPHMHQLFDTVRIGTPIEITYETVKVGYGDGIVFLVVYPDVYGKKTNAPERVRAVLEQAGVSGAVSDTELRARVAQHDGVARPLLGSLTPVTINGAPWTGPLGVTLLQGTSYLPLPHLARAVGAQVEEMDNAAQVTYQGKTATFPVDGRTAFRALDTIFIATRPFTTALGGAVDGTGGKVRITLGR